jgi:hypothetical protein
MRMPVFHGEGATVSSQPGGVRRSGGANAAALPALSGRGGFSTRPAAMIP